MINIRIKDDLLDDWRMTPDCRASNFQVAPDYAPANRVPAFVYVITYPRIGSHFRTLYPAKGWV